MRYPHYSVSLRTTAPGKQNLENIHSAALSPEIFIPQGGISGFSAEPAGIVTTSSLIHGQTLHGFDYPPLAGSVTLILKPGLGETIQGLYRRVAGLVNHQEDSARLIVSWVPGQEMMEETRTLPVRLVSPPEAPSGWTREATGTEITLNLISDHGYWRGPVWTSPISVTNEGDLPIYPKLIFTSTGGKYLISNHSNSGVEMEVPAGAVVIETDPQRMMLLVDGVQQRQLLPQLSIISDPVNPSEVSPNGNIWKVDESTGGGHTPVEATITWENKYLSAWTD